MYIIGSRCLQETAEQHREVSAQGPKLRGHGEKHVVTIRLDSDLQLGEARKR